jgi:hypothetical protein
MLPRYGRKSLNILILASICLFGAMSAAAFQVGLPPLQGTADLSDAERLELESAVRDELTAAFPSTEWQFMSGDLISLAMEAENLDPASCSEEDCFAGLGRALKLDILIMGYFRRSSNEDRLLLKLYDISSGKMEGFIRVSGSEPRALRSSLPDDCRRLLHPYRNWKPAEDLAGDDTDALTQAWAAQNDDPIETLVGGEEEAPDDTVLEFGEKGRSGSLLSGWSFGPSISTYSGPNHAVLMNHVNNIMTVMGEPISRFQSFEVGTSIGLSLLRHFNGPISFAGTYHFTQYTQNALFVPHGWESPRELNTQLHEFGLGVHFALDFVRSKTVEPFVAAGMTFLYADSQLDILLDNIPNSPDGNPDTAYENRNFLLESADLSVGAEAYVGLNYRITPHLMIQGQLGGTMGQVNQNFDYDGSLQHIFPNSDPEDVENPGNNDILWGSYPLELNGLRLSLGMLISL